MVTPHPATDAVVAATPSVDAGRGSTNTTALALVAGAAVLVGAGAVHLGMRARSDVDVSIEDQGPPIRGPVDPPPGGSDPLA